MKEETTEQKSEEQKSMNLTSPMSMNLTSPMTGLPKHGTRWARAKHPTPRELDQEERIAPL
jgi:hypothetical protein